VDDRAPEQRGVGVRAGRDDLAGGLDPGHERQLDRVGPALAVLEVDVVDADPAVADEELVGARNRIGAFDRPQRSRPAMPTDLDRQHRRRSYTAHARCPPAPLMPEAESLALPLRGPKHAPVARSRVLLLVVQRSSEVPVPATRTTVLLCRKGRRVRLTQTVRSASKALLDCHRVSRPIAALGLLDEKGGLSWPSVPLDAVLSQPTRPER
jgi:hypothetical protein